MPSLTEASQLHGDGVDSEMTNVPSAPLAKWNSTAAVSLKSKSRASFAEAACTLSISPHTARSRSTSWMRFTKRGPAPSLRRHSTS